MLWQMSLHQMSVKNMSLTKKQKFQLTKGQENEKDSVSNIELDAEEVEKA